MQEAASASNVSKIFEDRYSRQILFQGIGSEGQKRLALARIAIVGVGATGAASASLLARAGVGQLTLIDRDFVEPSNLQRQILFDEADAREELPKAEAARRKIHQFNSGVAVHAVIQDLVPGNIEDLLGDCDLILDCTDNFETRYLLNDYAVQEGKPWIYAAAVGAYAASMNILPRTSASSEAAWENDPSACLACLFPSAPSGPVETCDTVGVLSTAVNLAASVQSTEAIKFAIGQIDRMRRTLISQDLWLNERSEVFAGVPRASCEVCGKRIFRHLAGERRPHITLCGRNSVQIHEHHRALDLAALHSRLRQSPEISALRSNSMLLRFHRAPHTVTVFPDGRALFQGTTDPSVARSLYARYIGN